MRSDSDHQKAYVLQMCLEGELLPDQISMDDKYDAVLAVDRKEDAEKLFALLVEHCMRSGKSREEAEKIELANIGYYSGYFYTGTRDKVEQLFETAHPVFGSVQERGVPTPQEAFRLGMEMARKSSEKKK